MFLAAFVAFASCKKEETTTPPVHNPTKKEMISRTWKVETMTVNQMPMPDSFFVNSRMTFKADGTYTTSDGSGDDDNGTWEFNSEENKIIMDKGTSDEETMDIVELSSSKLRVKETMDDDTLEMTLIPA
jgi:hypothetical protein